MSSSRLPPFDEAAEKAVIGCCVTTPAESIPETALVVTSQDYFYNGQCRGLWAVLASFEPHKVNVITLADKMAVTQRKEVVMSFLSECQDAAFSSANLPVWLEMIQEKYLLRKVIATATQAIQEAYITKDGMDLLDKFERNALMIRPAKRIQTDIKSLVSEALEKIEYRTNHWNSITGLSTGLHDLDRKSDGLHKGEMIVLAALPSCGKSALAVNIAVHNALKGIPVGILSAEMRPIQLVIRSLCAEARVNFKRVTSDDCHKLIFEAGRLAAAPIYIQQASGWSIAQAMACARHWKHAYGIELAVADYIQKFTGKGDNREREIASIGSGFKDIAMELEIPVMALSQVNDDGKLRESRALSQDSDSVWILKNKGEWKPDIQPVQLAIEKCRDGETGTMDLIFQKEITRFESAANEDEQDGLPMRSTSSDP